MNVDFGRRSRDYAEHRPGFPASFHERLERTIEFPGAAVLDIGTGPGVLALEFAARGTNVVGIDVAENQILEARRRAGAAGLTQRTEFAVRPAEHTGLPAGRFDLAVAGQCWHWLDQDAALTELRRVLRPGGLLVLAYFSYLTRYSDVARWTERLVLKHNPGWTMAGSDGMFPGYADALAAAGFEPVDGFSYLHDQRFTHEAWRGRMRTCNGIGSGGLTPEGVERFDTDLTTLLRERFPAEPLTVTHRVWAVVVRAPA